MFRALAPAPDGIDSWLAHRLSSLLADAERAEDRTEQVIAAVAAGDFAEGVMGMPQFFGGEFTGAGAGEQVRCLIEMRVDLPQGKHMPAARAERAFATTRTGQMLEVLAQRVESLTGVRRGP